MTAGGRRCWKWLILALSGALALAVLVAWSGVINVGASSGHWRITAWGLHWVMQNSTRTYAHLEPQPPDDLDSATNVRRAAGHYESDCAFCHGSPLAEPHAVVNRMTPPPPGLLHVTDKWEPRALARIVRHGIKYTAMPAWIATERNDEVWAMVAFLRALPNLSADQYRAMVSAPARTQDRVLEACAGCHGLDGASQGGAFPVIGGQNEAYLVETLRAFADGARHSGFMQSAVQGLSEDDLRRLADHYAAQPGLLDAAPPPVGEGAGIALHGLPKADVPACESCHGPSERRNPAYPRLAGQDAGYIANQLRLMKDGKRGGTAYSRVMHPIAERLPDAAIDAIARYYSSAGTRAR